MSALKRGKSGGAGRGRRGAHAPKLKRGPGKPLPARKKKSAAGRPRTSAKMYRIVAVDKPPGKDAQGKEFRRFFQIETLTSALERALEKELPTLQRVWTVVRGADAAKLRLELLRETRYTLSYRLSAAAGTGKRVAVTLVAAKNAEECAKKAEAEYGLLKELDKRAPKYVQACFEAGTLFLPDRYRRKSRHRDLFFYLAEDLPGFHQVGDSKAHQFVLQSEPPLRLSIDETEQAKARFTELVASSYDAKTRTALGVGRIEASDLLVRRGGGAVRLKLCGCRGLLTRATPARLLDLLQDAAWNWGTGPFHPIPRAPEDFIAALEKALGKAVAREWIQEYVRRVRAGSYPGRNPDHLAALEDHVA